MKSMAIPGQDDKKSSKYKNRTPPNIYSNIYMSPFVEAKNDNELNTQLIDRMLENEKQQNKTEPWNKLNKTVKIQKLNAFADKYKKEHGINAKETKALKTFFIDSLEKNKLQKTKDLVYDKETQEIIEIPALSFHPETRNFTLKNMDKTRISTLKSLTPKKTAIIISVDNDGQPLSDVLLCPLPNSLIVEENTSVTNIEEKSPNSE